MQAHSRLGEAALLGYSEKGFELMQLHWRPSSVEF
jgi:hypothetical protein